MRSRRLDADNNAVRSRSRGKAGRAAAANEARIETMSTTGPRFGAAHRFRPAAASTTERTPRGRHRIVDGPFAETKEYLG
jgi:hypothetical protein